MNNPKLPVTLRAQTGAPLYGHRDCSTHVRSRWSFDRTTAVLPKHAGPFYLRVRLERRRCAGDAQPTCQSATRILPHPVPLLSHRIPFNESTRARLLLSLGIGAGGLEKHEDAVGLDQVFRSVSGENNSGFRSSRAS